MKKLRLIMVGFLLSGSLVSSVTAGLASTSADQSSRMQSTTYQYLSISPSQGTIVSRPQVIPGTSGDLHVAYSAYTANGSGQFPAYYAYCAANCSTASNWSLVEVGQLLALGNYTRLAVDPNNHPRLMWESWASGGAVTGFYHYSECNAGCTNKANWSVPVTFAETGATNEPHYYFNLDHLGRPRFVYADNRYTHTGTFYVYCDSGCANAVNWHEVTIATFETSKFSLEFTSANQPRVAFSYFDGANYSVGYSECDSACTVITNWAATLLWTVGLESNLRMGLDSNDQPRIAFYTAKINDGDPANDLAFYTWCNAACSDGNNWDITNLGQPIHYGETLDLVLDNQDHPHMALYANTAAPGLVHLSCSANCESISGTWVSEWVETDSEMNARYPVPVESGCTLSEWHPGGHPSIAMIRNSLVFAYDAEHTQSGITCPVHTDYRDTTLALGSVNYSIYLPMLKK